MLRVISHDSDCPPVHLTEPDRDVLGVEGHDLEKLALVHDAVNDVENVVRRGALQRDHGVEAGHVPIPGIITWLDGYGTLV